MFCRYFVNCVIVLYFCNLFVSCNDVIKDEKIEGLPFCGPGSYSQHKSKKLVFVSTLDGQVSMLNIVDGVTKEWSVSTGPGPMLSSNIHKLELTNNGQWVRMIPSLNGGLYKFNGEFIEAIPITAEHLLKSSFRYSDDLVISGGKESRTYGVEVVSGRVLYECTMNSCDNMTDEVDNVGDVVLIQRLTQTVRAVEPRTGAERWNFSVGQHDLKFAADPTADCHTSDPSSEIILKVIVPEGLVCAMSKAQPGKVLWTHKFESPVVSAWRLDKGQMVWVDLFGGKTPSLPNGKGENKDENIMPDSPALYVGMHKKQLYIQESVTMQNMLHSVASQYKQHLIGTDKGFPRIPWQPVPASTVLGFGMKPEANEVLQITDESSTQELTASHEITATSVLYGSEYVNGNGYYLYSAETVKKSQNALCRPEDEINSTLAIEGSFSSEEDDLDDDDDDETPVQIIIVSLWYWWKEVIVISLSTAIIINILLQRRTFSFFTPPPGQELMLYVKQPQFAITEGDSGVDLTRGFGKLLAMNAEYTSRYLTDFEQVHCLGKGGFGVVFEAKNKIDDCHYAVKRIPLPNREESRERVMREVKALAKLDHKNIVRYFNAWLECPPPGWQEAQDQLWSSKSNLCDQYSGFNDATSVDLTNQLTPDVEQFSDADTNLNHRSNRRWQQAPSTDRSDSFIVFESSQKNVENRDTEGSDQKLIVQDSVIAISSTSDTSGNINNVKKRHSKRPSSLSLKSSEVSFSKQADSRMFLFIQMQLCRKESLREWLTCNTEKREADLVLNIFEQIVQAVEYVHLKGLIHRDLKPSNIFFSPDGQIKVGDFGLVTAMAESGDQWSPCDASPSPDKTMSDSERHTARVGTHLYMSPEQISGKLYSYKVDIYSLGLILFELLVPFSTQMERIHTLQDLRNNVFPTHFQNSFKNEYDLLSVMLSHQPEKRPTTIGIRARAPLNKTPEAAEDMTWHFELPSRRKTSSHSSSQDS